MISTTTAPMPISVTREDPFSVEVYADVMPAQALPAEHFEREEKEYSGIGLTELAKRSQQAVAQRRGHVVGHRLSTQESTVWRWRYPTVYATAFRTGPWPRLDQVVYPWARLTWPVPTEVRQLIVSARDVFDGLEIWTPELRPVPRVGPSPILIGVRGGEQWLLARWAEVLEPFEEIQAKMHSREGRRAMRVRRDFTRNNDASAIPYVVAAFIAVFSLVFMLAYASPFAGIGLVVSLGIIARSTWFVLPSSRRWACQYAGWVMGEEDQ